jgi:hypothetical protein
MMPSASAHFSPKHLNYVEFLLINSSKGSYIGGQIFLYAQDLEILSIHHLFKRNEIN